MKDLILSKITKQCFVSKKFLREQNITEQECYNIVHGNSLCKYCNSIARFNSWKHGYLESCDDIECKRKLRKERTVKTNINRYGVSNISQLKSIQAQKQQTFENNYGVSNISQLEYVQSSIRSTMERLGRWLPYEQLDDKKEYELKVRKLSEKQNIKSLPYYERRGPVENDGYHLDHILSISDGFKTNIPIHIISNINNLRFIPARKNQSKNYHSDISLNELMYKILS